MDTWSRAMLKTRAKEVLKQHYWMIFLACFIAGLLGGSGTGSSSGFSGSGGSNGSGGSLRPPSSESFQAILGILAIVGIFVLLAILIGIAFSTFVSNVVQVGLCRFLMETRQGNVNLGLLFWAFKKDRYMKVVKTMFLYRLYIFLWSLLLIIPGIIKSYEYYYVPYILAENPDIEPRRIFDLSQMMTAGEKWAIFVLGLSFWGWIFLGILACCIGTIFVTPYIKATNAELYGFVRERSMGQGIAGSSELQGFDFS